jgi:PKD repeat protein
VITAPASASGSEGIALTITATATDPDPLSDLTITATGFPPGMIVQSIVRPSPATATITGTPGYAAAGSYVIRWMVTDTHGLSASTNTALTIANTDRPPTLDPVASMRLCEGSTANQAITASDPDGDAMTFSKADGPAFMTVTTTSPASGNIHLAPGFTDAGAFTATARASDGFLNSDQSFSITVTNDCRAPVLNPIADMTVNEGETADQTITASDPDGDPLTFSRYFGPIFMTVATTDPGTGSATGTIHLAPGPNDSGSYPSCAVRVSDGAFEATGSFSITVQSSGNHCPASIPGGPYSGVVDAPVAFDGTASYDPDGNSLSYAWDFDAADGVGTDATGPTPSHTYDVTGTYLVTLTVSDGLCDNFDMTTAFIAAGACPATVFNGSDVIRLGSGKPTWFAFVQPTGGCYSNADVVLSSFVLKYAGRQISADVSKTTVFTDKNGDGIQEIRVSFSKANLRILFSGTGLGNGHNLVTVTIQASLVTGGSLQGTTQVDVVNNGSFTAALVSPNPLNPVSTVTYTTSKPGFVRIDMFDIQGRLVRRIVDEPAMTAGTHEATIDGRGERGEKLPSGVYFIRGTSAEGEFKRIVTILK